MCRALVPSIYALFSRQSHCINCGGIRPLYFSLTGQQWQDVKSFRRITNNGIFHGIDMCVHRKVRANAGFSLSLIIEWE